MTETAEPELESLCEKIMMRRGVFSFMDVARAMCVRCKIRDGDEEARRLAKTLEISPQTLWNWLNRDLPSWAEKMRARCEPAKLGQPLDFPARGRRISESDLAMIAALMRKMPRRPTARQLRAEIWILANRDIAWAHLKDISHSFLHRKRHDLNKRVADAEREEALRKTALKTATELPAVTGAIEGMAGATLASPATGRAPLIAPLPKPKIRGGEISLEYI